MYFNFFLTNTLYCIREVNVKDLKIIIIFFSFFKVPKSKSPQSGSSSNASSSSSGSHQQLPEAAGEPSKAAGDVRELVMKQQEALLASLKCLPPRPLLMANPR